MTSGSPSSADLDDRLAALARRHELTGGAAAKLRSLLNLLVDDPLAPTAVRAPMEVIDDHLADSLVALELDKVRRSCEAVDLGSGAGLPGLPLAIALPDVSFVLLESVARKCAFLERALGACRITNARVVRARAEEWKDGLGCYDLVTARALARPDVVAEYAAPLLRLGGTLVAWRGRRNLDLEAAADRAAAALGMEITEIRRVHPYAGANERHLYLISKVKETPLGYPRRPGMAQKRPLGLAPRRASHISSDRARR